MFMNNASSTLQYRRFWELLKFEVGAYLIQIRTLAIFLTVPLFTQLFVSRSIGVPDLPWDFPYSSNEFYLVVFLPMLLSSLLGIGPLGQMSGQSLDFIFTRAVSRKMLFRAKSTIYFLCLGIPLLFTLGSACTEPDLTLRGFPRSDYPYPLRLKQDRYLKTFPGSYEEKLGSATSVTEDNRIHIPGGNIWMATWAAWRMLLVAVLLQALAIGMIQRRKHLGRVAYMTLFLFPLALIFLKLWIDPANNMTNDAFIFLRLHWAIMWTGLLLCGVLVQFYGERQFKRMELL